MKEKQLKKIYLGQFILLKYMLTVKTNLNATLSRKPNGHYYYAQHTNERQSEVTSVGPLLSVKISTGPCKFFFQRCDNTERLVDTEKKNRR